MHRVVDRQHIEGANVLEPPVRDGTAEGGHGRMREASRAASIVV